MMQPLDWHEEMVQRRLDNADRNERDALLALERAHRLRFETQQYAKKIDKARKAGKKEMKVE